MPSADEANTYGLEPTSRDQVSLLSVLRRRALIVILTTLLCGAAAAAFAYANGDSYSSTAKLLFKQTVGPELNAVGIPPTSPDADNNAQNDVQYVDSKRVAVATSNALGQRGVDMSPSEVDDNVAVTGPKDSEVVDVVATASSAKRAALVANVYADTARRLFDADQRAQARRALDNENTKLAQLSPAERLSQAGGRLRGNIDRLETLADVGTGNPRIMQPGYVPSAATGNPIQTIVLGALFGMLLGVGLALLREQSDRRLHHAEQVSVAFDAPVLTTVPRNRKLKRHRPFADLPPEVAEAFRMLQMNLRFVSEHPIRSVVVTSARPRQGKTTVSWNLASAASSAGLSVALVEADMRRPSLAARYGLPSEPGLSEVLGGEIPVADALMSVPSASLNGHGRPLRVLTAGNPPPDPSALMQSSVMPRLLDVLKRDYDLVIIDTPPIPHVADAISLLRRVDGVLVVASINSTSGPEAGRLRHQLQTLDARVVGVVANRGSASNGYAYAPTKRTAAVEQPGSTDADFGAIPRA